MQRVMILMAAFVMALFASCEEQIPPGLDLGGSAVAVDSTYIASVETKQDKQVLIEEITGVTCTNCPDGARQLKSIIQQNGDKAILVAIHGTAFAIPYNESKYDFRTEKGEQIINALGQPALPAAAVDRIPDGLGVYYRSKSEWSGLISDRIANTTTPVNIHLEGNYATDNNSYQLTARVAFTESYADKLNLTVYIIEDNIKDYQLDNSVKIPDYKHDHVFRDCITNIAGTPLDLGDKIAGRVMQKVFTFNPNINSGANSWNLDNCYIVAYVTNPDTREVLHVEEIKMR